MSKHASCCYFVLYSCDKVVCVVLGCGVFVWLAVDVCFCDWLSSYSRFVVCVLSLWSLLASFFILFGRLFTIDSFLVPVEKPNLRDTRKQNIKKTQNQRVKHIWLLFLVCYISITFPCFCVKSLFGLLLLCFVCVWL